MTCDSQRGERGRESGRVGKVRNDQEQCEQQLSTLCGTMYAYLSVACRRIASVIPRKARKEAELGMITDFRQFLRDTASDFPSLFWRTHVGMIGMKTISPIV